jgi:hypothetical protein
MFITSALLIGIFTIPDFPSIRNSLANGKKQALLKLWQTNLLIQLKKYVLNAVATS